MDHDVDAEAILSRRAALMKAALAGAGVLALTSVAHADAEPGPEADAAPEMVEEPQACLSIQIDPEPEACAAPGGEVDARWLAVPAAIVVAKQLGKK